MKDLSKYITEAEEKEIVSLLRGKKGEKGEDGKNADVEEVSKIVAKPIAKLLKEDKDFLGKIKGEDGKSGKNGKDGESPEIDIVEVTNRVINILPKQQVMKGEDGKDGSSDTSKEIIEKINKSRGEKINKSKIEGFDDIESYAKSANDKIQKYLLMGGSTLMKFQANGVAKGDASTVNFVNGTVTNTNGTINYTGTGGSGGGQVNSVVAGTGISVDSTDPANPIVTNTSPGTVTSVSVTPANGVTGTVANSTTTPAITLTLGAITPTTIVASGAVSGSNLSGSNTGDQTISDATITTSDITTNNVSTTKHGFAPKAPNDATKFLDGTGAYSTPAGGGDMVLASVQTNSGVKTFLDTTMKLRNVANTFSGVFTNAITADRVYTLQDRAGTLADNTDLALKAPIASPTFTGTVTVPTPFTLGAISVTPTGTELNCVSGVTSAIQTQLNAKGSGTVTSVTSANSNATVATTTTSPVITIVSAPKLTTARTIAGVSFDGSGNIAIAASNLSDGTTGTGVIVLATSPALTNPTATTQSQADNSTKVATTAYVDAAIVNTRRKEAAKYGSTAALPAIVYNNGTAGQGATLTGVAMGALGLDSNSPAVADRVLIKNQVSTFQNGIYVVTATGSGIAVFVLTRSTDTDQSLEYKTGDAVFVTSGTVLAATTWAYNGIDSPTMGTTSIPFVQAAGPGINTAGNGITITGSSIAIDTTVTVDKTTAQALTNKDLTGAGNTFPTFNQNTTGSAATLTTSRTIAGVSFNGSANISIASTNLSDTTSIALLTSTQTLTNKRNQPRIVSAASYTTDTGTSLDVSTADIFIITAQAGALLFNSPSGTPVQGEKLIIRIKDNGTARALTWNAVFRASSDLALPSTTILSKTLYLGFIYNSTDTKFDLLALLNNF